VIYRLPAIPERQRTQNQRSREDFCEGKTHIPLEEV